MTGGYNLRGEVVVPPDANGRPDETPPPATAGRRSKRVMASRITTCSRATPSNATGVRSSSSTMPGEVDTCHVIRPEVGHRGRTRPARVREAGVMMEGVAPCQSSLEI